MAVYMFQWSYIVGSMHVSKRVDREMGLAFLTILLI